MFGPILCADCGKPFGSYVVKAHCATCRFNRAHIIWAVGEAPLHALFRAYFPVLDTGKAPQGRGGG